MDTAKTVTARLTRVGSGATQLIETRIDDEQDFNFEPGQYSAIELTADLAVILSIASGPSRLPLVRFLYRETPGDAAAAKLSEALCSATTLRLRAPQGRVCWPVSDGAEAPKPRLFISAGTGIAQAFSVLETLFDQAPERLAQCTLLALAGSQAEQLLHPEEARWIEQGLVVQRLNDPRIGPDNSGLQWLAEQAADLARQQTQILIGGGPAFVYTVHDLLVAGGVAPAQLHADAYEYAPRP